MITILTRIMSSPDVINFKVKIGIKELGNDVYLNKKRNFTLLKLMRYVVSE
jgi:hypothetical protein